MGDLTAGEGWGRQQRLLLRPANTLALPLPMQQAYCA